MNLLETATKIGVDGFLHPAEAEKLAELAVNRDVLEVGSFKGLSAFCMAIGAKSVYCVDTFRAATDGQRQTEEFTTYPDFLAAVKRFTNVEHCVGTSETAAKSMPPDKTFGMIFLDAMHTKEDVKADIMRWWPRLRPGGLMVFHDYAHKDFPGVKQAVDEIFGPQEDTIVTLMWIRKPWKAWRCEQADLPHHTAEPVPR
jgi:predicted O-methyltransferase YrrM